MPTAALVTPHYNKPTQEGLYQHYKLIADSVAIRRFCTTCGRTACDMKPETVEALADIPNIVGIREASGSIERIRELVRRLGDRMDVYSGEDGIAAEAILNGAKGTIFGHRQRRAARHARDVRRRVGWRPHLTEAIDNGWPNCTRRCFSNPT